MIENSGIEGLVTANPDGPERIGYGMAMTLARQSVKVLSRAGTRKIMTVRPLCSRYPNERVGYRQLDVRR